MIYFHFSPELKPKRNGFLGRQTNRSFARMTDHKVFLLDRLIVKGGRREGFRRGC